MVNKKKEGLSRLFEIAGQKKSLLLLAGLLSAGSAVCMLIPYWAIYRILYELLNHSRELSSIDETNMIRWGWIAFGGLIGGLIGLLGGPLGVLLGGSVGLLVGSAVDAKDSFQSASLLQQVSTKMGDGQVALLALAQESDTMLFNAKLANFDVNIVRYDASEVQEEVEEAKQLQKEMEEQTRQAMRIQRSEERKAKVEKHRQKIKENFEEFKQKHNLN